MLTKKHETEGLTYRLSLSGLPTYSEMMPMHGRALFRAVRDFSVLRSRIVPGVTLDTKSRRRRNALDCVAKNSQKSALIDDGALF